MEVNATDSGNPAAPQGEDDERVERRLIMHARAGDGHATGELLRSYQNRIYALCVRILGQRDDAADVTQDVLVKVMTRLGTFDGRSALSTWIYRIAVNACLSHLRRRKARRLTSGGGGIGDERLAESMQNEEPGRVSGVETSERVAELLRALETLGDEARVLLLLRDGRGLNHTQIAEVLDLPVGTVKSRLYRARSALRDAMTRSEARGERLFGAEAGIKAAGHKDGRDSS